MERPSTKNAYLERINKVLWHIFGNFQAYSFKDFNGAIGFMNVFCQDHRGHGQVERAAHQHALQAQALQCIALHELYNRSGEVTADIPQPTADIRGAGPQATLPVAIVKRLQHLVPLPFGREILHVLGRSLVQLMLDLLETTNQFLPTDQAEARPPVGSSSSASTMQLTILTQLMLSQ